MKKHLNLKIYGKVQGVSFRYYAKQKADELGVFGFVKNQKDGTLYIEAEGFEEDLSDFLTWCYKGPESVEVVKIERNAGDVKNYQSFDILR